MRLTIEINDQLYHQFQEIVKTNRSSVEEELQKAIMLITKRRSLINSLMHEVCIEYDEAMEKLSH